VGVPIQKENEVPLGPEAKGGQNGEKVYPPHPTLGLVHRELSRRPKNGFIVI